MERQLMFMSGRLNIVKMSILPKQPTDSGIILIKIPTALFAKIEKCILKFTLNLQRPKIDKIIFKKESELKGSYFLISNHITKLQ